ncbi:MAG: flagellar hook-basal body complex protein [Campylobacterota bacterium]|nr:flagellar hook-basal body complex protein [Campylobacterota bacterium]
MNQAFYTGLTGMQSYQFGLDVISNNISNINTTGFRSSNAEFASFYDNALGAALNGGPTNDGIGTGVRVQTTTMDESYGSFLSTDSATDLSIGGDGWFGVTSNFGDMFTRAGAFTFDSDRNLVSYDGMYLLGTMGNNLSGDTMTDIVSTTPLAAASAQDKITLPVNLTIDAEPTTTANFWGNLRSDEALIRQNSTVIAPDGDDSFLTLDYTKSAIQPEVGSSWDILATLSSKVDNTVFDTQEGVAVFNSNGALESYTIAPLDNEGVSLTVDLGEDFAGVTAIDNLEVSYGSSHDGRTAGELIGYDVNIHGEVIASFDNGVSSSVARVAIFHFQNDQGLERISGTHFKESSNSGEPIFYTNENGESILGADLKSFSLENSNMQFEQGLTELIIMQRSLDANSKSITTGDELIKKALEMDA